MKIIEEMKMNELASVDVIRVIEKMNFTNEDFQRICEPKSWSLKQYLNYLRKVTYLRESSHKRSHANKILREYQARCKHLI